MLTIRVPGWELYDESTNRLFERPSVVLNLEHSLISISKWEGIWCKPFLGKEQRTIEETLSYIECMTLNKNVPSDVYYHLGQSDIDRVNEYIDAPMTATTFRKTDGLRTASRSIITSEIIYWWMIQGGIPFECQKWHLNRLLTLINVVNLKRVPPKKMSRREIFAQNRALNAARKAEFNTRG